MSDKIVKYLDWLADLDKPLTFFVIYIFTIYETLFFVCWYSFGLTNLTLRGKITAVVIALLFSKVCIYDYIKRNKQ